MNLDPLEDKAVEAFIDRTATTRDTELFKAQLAAGVVAICPGTPCDWNAVARLTDVAQTFVFCDRNGSKVSAQELSLERCPPIFGNLFTEAGSGELDTHVRIGPSPAANFGGLAGRYQFLERKINMGQHTLSRDILLVVIDADPIAAYTKLFVEAGVSPRILLALHIDSDSALRDYVLQRPEAEPKSIIGAWPRAHGPYNWVWRKLSSWGEVAEYRRRDGEGAANPPIQLPQDDNVVFTTMPLIPHELGNHDAVVVSLESYLEGWWLPPRLRIFIDSEDADAVTTIRAFDARVRPLTLRGRPLGEAADALADACGTTVHSVHVMSLGLEDEQQAVWLHWRLCYPHLRLVLHGTAAEFQTVLAPIPGLLPRPAAV